MADGYRRNQIVSGAFILIALGIFLYFAFKLGSLDPRSFFEKDPLHCVCYLSEIETLETGAQVVVGGKEVGEVTRIRYALRPLDDSELKARREAMGDTQGVQKGEGASYRGQVVEIGFVIKNSALFLHPERARARLGQDGFLGAHFIELLPGMWGQDETPKLALDFEGSSDAPFAIGTGELGGLSGLIAEAQPLIRRVGDIIEKIDRELFTEKNLEHLRDLMRDLKAAGASVKRAMADAEELLDADKERSLYQSILQPANAAIKNIESKLDAVLTTLLEETLKQQVPSVVEQANATLVTAQNAIQRLQQALDENDAKIQALLDGQVKEVMDNLVVTTGNLESRLNTLQGRAVGLMDQATGVITDNRANLAETLRRLRRTMWHTEMAIRKVRSNPGVILWGDDEALMNAREFDEESIRRAGRARPYGQRDENDDGR